MKTVYLYTDGACSQNPGPGGYGVILKYKNITRELSGGEKNTTNNRMELMGVIAGLEALNEKCRVVLTSDSKYVIDGLSKGWAESWQKKGWIKSNREKALNPDLWERLLKLTNYHEMEYNWVRGHAGHPENERCDALAVEASKKYV